MDERLRAHLTARGEHFALGWVEMEAAPVIRQFGRALRRQLEGCALPAWHGEPFYPAGAYTIWQQGANLSFHYSFPFSYSPSAWQAQVVACPDADLRMELAVLGERFAAHPDISACLPPEDCVGGNGYTHSILDYGRIVTEGLTRHDERVRAGLARC